MPRAWFDGISSLLVKSEFHMGKLDSKSIYQKEKRKDLLMMQTYVDDIISDATNEILGEYFATLVKTECEMSMMVGLHSSLVFKSSKQLKESSSTNQSSTNEIIKRFGMDSTKPCRIL